MLNIALVANFSDFTICQIVYRFTYIAFADSCNKLQVCRIFMLAVLEFSEGSVCDNHRGILVFRVDFDYQKDSFSVPSAFGSDLTLVYNGKKYTSKNGLFDLFSVFIFIS